MTHKHLTNIINFNIQKITKNHISKQEKETSSALIHISKQSLPYSKRSQTEKISVRLTKTQIKKLHKILKPYGISISDYIWLFVTASVINPAFVPLKSIHRY